MPSKKTPKACETLSVFGLSRNLCVRFISSVIMAPPILFLIYIGGVYFELLVALISGLMAWEVARLITKREKPITAILAAATNFILILFLTIKIEELHLSIFGIFLFTLIVLASVMSGLLSTSGRLLLGNLIILIPCCSAIWLRVNEGAMVVIWLVAIIVASDVGAYIAGKGIGGYKLAPKISPNKTWAGLVGGLNSSIVVGNIIGAFWLDYSFNFLVAASFLLALVAQIGDLLESAFKRSSQVKDSGSIIPGHGGVLDRLDGHLAGMMLAAIFLFLQEHLYLL